MANQQSLEEIFGNASGQASSSSQPAGSLEEIFGDSLTKTQAATPTQILLSTVKKKNLGSPLTLGERFSMGFANDANKEAILKSKFNFVQRLPNGKYSAGNTLDTMAPVDPAGLFNDVLGDIADISSLIPPIAGQIMGSVGAGIATGFNPAAIVAGGALGAGLGEGVSKTIGKGLGVNTQNAEQIAADMAISTTFGAIGEGVGLGLQGAAPIVAKKALGAFSKMLGKSPISQDAAISTLAKTMKISSNVNPEATTLALKYGPDVVFTPFNTNINNSAVIAKDVVDDIFIHRRQLGDRLGAALKGFGKGADVEHINISKSVSGFLKELVDEDILKPDFTVNRNFITDGSDLTIFRKVLGTLGLKKSSTGASFTFKNKITPKQAVQLKRQLAAKFESLSPNGGRIITKFRSSISQNLDDFASRSGNVEFLTANRAFAEFADSMDNLRESGFNLDRQASVDNFIRGFLRQNPTSRNAINAIDNQTPLPILQKIEKFAAAQEFNSASPNILRFGFIAGLLGFSSADTPTEKAGFLGLAALAGSPAGNKLLLKSGQKIVRGFTLRESLPSGLASKVKNLSKQQQTALRSLLVSAATQTETKKPQPQPQ